MVSLRETIDRRAFDENGSRTRTFSLLLIFSSGATILLVE